MKNKVLISPSKFADCGNDPLELLEKENIEYIINPFGRKMDPAEVIQYGKDCIGIIAGIESLNAEVLASIPTLRCISRVGSGIDTIDIEKAREMGIVITNTPDGPTRAVAELALGLIFDLLRKISFRDREIRKGNWNKEMGNLLENKKIGVLGLGRIGRTVAELLQVLGASVSGTDLQADEKWLNEKNIPLLTLDELLKTNDIICVHIPFSGGVKHFIGERELRVMKKGAYLVNLSRGGVVDEQALYQVLQEKHLSGAASDVFEQEPYTGPLTELDNIVLTSHVGSYAKESRLKMEMDATRNLLEHI
ncbi:MAG: phosphoglycerate dehydrogenase [Pseudomonadota bacterium]